MDNCFILKWIRMYNGIKLLFLFSRPQDFPWWLTDSISTGFCPTSGVFTEELFFLR